ncbi:beta-lactamase family protein [Roseomonas sp. GC11]|uniref:serine hydrolase domain-containing protein n=1 Tax=Roseomonas sp. GC11 TaxID=2950546 RepID=UPI002108A4E3|nr:serine hydrolase domain-containing protein [Roseomonas sp. GC11]MCQ4162728.1 beta-lactamase family protein [Roseomonas sp. GC11]
MPHPAPDWSAAHAAAEAVAAPWREGVAPGGAILAFDARRIAVEVAGGVESLATGAPFSGGSVVRYASVTKHVLAALALEAGPALDEPLGAHLPFLRGDLAGVPFGRALDMTGGLPDVRETLALLGISVTEVTEAAAIEDFLGRQSALNFTPGHEISYSNTGYRLVEAALARRGHPFAGFVARLSASLGLAWTAPEHWSDPVPGLVPGYWLDGGTWRLGMAGLHLSASGCLTGSGHDLARWGQALLAGEGLAAGLLARQGAPRHLADGRATGYGLGLAHGRLGPVALLGHGGSHVGYKTYLLLAPEAGCGVVIVSNREDTASYGAALRVMAGLLGQPLPTPAAPLPEGLYAEPGSPHWLEIRGGAAHVLGSAEALYAAEDGAAVSLSAHLPVRLRATAEGLAGEVGHAARLYRPVTAAPEEGLEAIQGTWRFPGEHASFTVEGDRLACGIGPARRVATLRGMGEGRILAERRDGPWSSRFLLAPMEGGLKLVANRSRVLVAERDH